MRPADGAASPSSEGGRRAVVVPGRGTGPASLLTERLHLDPVTEADLEELFALHADPRAFAEDSTAPLTAPGQMRHVLARWRESWARHGIGHRTVRRRDDAPAAAPRPPGLLGVVGLVPLPDGDGTTVLSAYWRLSPGATGHGIATEAMRAVLAATAGAGAGAGPEIVAVTAAGNRPSLALAARLGFVPAAPSRPVPGGRAGDVLLTLPADG